MASRASIRGIVPLQNAVKESQSGQRRNLSSAVKVLASKDMRRSQWQQARLMASSRNTDPWAQVARQVAMSPPIFLKRIQDICADSCNAGWFEHADPVIYHNCAEAFKEAMKAGSSPGATVLEDYPEYDSRTIFETACIMDILSHKRGNPFPWAMWASSSAMGFVPATLTLAQELVIRNRWGRVPIMKKTEMDFQRILSAGKDPNALAIEGGRLFNDKKNPQAKAKLRQALSLGGTDFSLKPLCHLFLGRIASADSKLEPARKEFEKSMEVYPTDTELEIGELLATTDLEASRHSFFLAGLHGNDEAYSRLADIESGISMEETDPEKSRLHSAMAMEFKKMYELGKSVA